MNVLVTGGAGFIGSHTVDLLIGNGFNVRVLDILDPQIHQGKKPSCLNEKAEFLEGDICNINVWKKSLEGIDAVIHLAAMTGIGQSMYQPTKYLTTNTIGTANFYQLLTDNPEIRKNIKKIIVASSKTIYGEGAYKCNSHGIIYPTLRTLGQLKKKDWEHHCPICKEPMKPIGISEEKPPQTLSIYAVSKFDTEKLSLMYGNAFEIPTIAFRYFSAFGPRQSLNNPYTGVCSIFLTRIKNNKPPVVYEDGNQVRDFIYVEDLARVNLLALEKIEETDYFNVGTGIPTSINDVANITIDILGSAVQPNVTGEFRIGDTRHDFADISKIEKKVGFKPKWSFKDGIKKLIEWSETEEAIDKFEQADKERKILTSK